MSVKIPGTCGLVILAAVVLAACLAAPASAVDKYSQGSPEFTATVVGTNEFTQGQEATIQVLVRNIGVNLFKELDEGTIAQPDLPNDAKFVTIGLVSDTPSIIVKSDPRYIGDMKGGGGSATAEFTVKITQDAVEQEYQLPVIITYQYQVGYQPTSEIYQYVYNEATATVPVTIRIKPEVSVSVLAIDTGNLTPGSEGIITARIQNTGSGTGEDAILKISRNGKSPVVPVDNTIYLGEFAAGAITESRFRVSVSDDASAQSYPVDLAITYKDHEGSKVTSSPVTIGIDILDKPEFRIVSSMAKVAAGSTAIITVKYQNTGGTTVYAAQAGISDHTPVTIANNVAYLGDVKQGETASAVFTVQADSSAEPGTYSFDSRIRYRDALGTSIQSDTEDLIIEIVPAEKGILNSAGLIILAVVIALGIVLVAYRYRKGMQ